MIEGFIRELGCTVRACLDCGVLVAGGPTRCGRCAHEYIPDMAVRRYGNPDGERRGNLAQLTGPITGMPDLNRRAFADAAEKITACGYGVWNPNDWNDLNPDYPNESRPKKFWMRRSIRMLFDADLLVLLPGWYFSDGSRGEREVARQFGMPVVYWSEYPRAYRCEWRR